MFEIYWQVKLLGKPS